MRPLLQRGIQYRHDSKYNTHFICNLLLYKEYVAHKTEEYGVITLSIHNTSFVLCYQSFLLKPLVCLQLARVANLYC